MLASSLVPVSVCRGVLHAWGWVDGCYAVPCGHWLWLTCGSGPLLHHSTGTSRPAAAVVLCGVVVLWWWSAHLCLVALPVAPLGGVSWVGRLGGPHCGGWPACGCGTWSCVGLGVACVCMRVLRVGVDLTHCFLLVVSPVGSEPAAVVVRAARPPAVRRRGPPQLGPTTSSSCPSSPASPPPSPSSPACPSDSTLPAGRLVSPRAPSGSSAVGPGQGTVGDGGGVGSPASLREGCVMGVESSAVRGVEGVRVTPCDPGPPGGIRPVAVLRGVGVEVLEEVRSVQRELAGHREAMGGEMVALRGEVAAVRGEVAAVRGEVVLLREEMCRQHGAMMAVLGRLVAPVAPGVVSGGGAAGAGALPVSPDVVEVKPEGGGDYPNWLEEVRASHRDSS